MSDVTPTKPDPTLPALTLRDYQTTDIDRLRAAYGAGARAPLYQLATGGGKTVVFSHVIASAAAKGRKVGVFVHRRELISQASAKLAWCGVPHGIIAAGLDRDHDLPVQVLSIQSAVNRTIPQFDFVVIDEAHHAAAETWHALLKGQTKAKLLGVTATPARTDGAGLGVECGGLFDAIVCGPTMEQLVEAGHLAPCKVFIPPQQIDTTGLRKVGGDWAAGEEMAKRAVIVTGDAIAHYRKHAAGKSAIAFCVTVAHAEHVAAEFAAAGYRAACVHGKTPKPERDDLIAGLGDGRLDVLTSCDLISEGLDVPSVGAVILLRPTGSLILALQQIGRGMRPKSDGGPLIVLDHAGNTLRHGLPEEDRTWTLAGTEKVTRAPAVVNEDGVNLGRPRVIEHVAGELVEAESDKQARARWARVSLGQFRKAPRSPQQIRAFGKVKGYKKGWAFYYAREQAERFGHGAPAA